MLEFFEYLLCIGGKDKGRILLNFVLFAHNYQNNGHYNEWDLLEILVDKSVLDVDLFVQLAEIVLERTDVLSCLRHLLIFLAVSLLDVRDV